MTTGSWFVLFKAEKCAHCAKVRPIFDQLGEDSEIAEKGIILATLDVPSNRLTASRFDIRGFPIMLYLHRGQIYRFKGARTFDALKEFLLHDSLTMMGGPIPKPMSSLEAYAQDVISGVREFYHLAMGRGGTVAWAMTILIIMFFGLLVGLVAMCFLPSSQHSKKE
jgi:thiol-disulfide isomerase/thioredoxin